jgi:urease accessory protein
LTLRATAIARAGSWPAHEARDEVAFDHDRRHRRRMSFATAGGLAILLDLREAIAARDGDAYVLEDGGFIRILATPEPLLDVTADPDTLARLAWHIGNRHLPAQFRPGGVRILDDHVIAEMLAGLGATVTRLDAPFDPEPGAYQHG